MIPPGFRYWAFISYSHDDAVAARALARAIETYRLPARLSTGPESRYPKRLSPIFRDRDEFSSSADLGTAIAEALRQSRALIVLCSPAAKASRWVNEEIRTFREQHGHQRIYAALLDGTPESAFPSQLTQETDRDGTPTGVTHEPLWVDLRPGKETKHDARLRLIAAILNVGFDALKQRDRARARRFRTRLAAAAAVVLAFVAFRILADMNDPIAMALAWRSAAPPPTVHAWSASEGFSCPNPTNCAFETGMADGIAGGGLSVFGGIANGPTPCDVLGAVQTYDVTSDRWRMRRPMPTPRAHLGIAAIGGMVYAVGGDVASVASAACVPTNVVEAYDPATDRWTQRAPLPQARCCFGTAVATDRDGKQKLYVFGGSGRTVAFPSAVYAYDPGTNRWERKQDLPHPGAWLTGATVGDTIYAIGRTADPQRDVLQPYLPAQDLWVENTPRDYSDDYGGSEGLWAGVEYSPGGRQWARPHAVVVDHDIYVIEGAAGETSGPALARVDIFQPSMHRWRSAPSLPVEPGQVVSLAVAGGALDVLTFGGPDAATKSYLRNWRLTGWWLRM